MFWRVLAIPTFLQLPGTFIILRNMLLQRLVELAIFTSIVGSVERAGKRAYLVILKVIRSILTNSSVKLDKTALQNVQRLSPNLVREKRTLHPYQFLTLPFQKHITK